MDFGFDRNMFGSGLSGFLGGIFGNSGRPYDKAMEQYQHYANLGQATQQPFLNAGTNAIGNFQNWLSGMQNPSQFINNQMANYQESPYAHYLQQQAMNAGQNAASASGLIGSSPFIQQMQRDASGIASGDMNQWLQNVLGINSQYGQGQFGLMNSGQQSANALTDMYHKVGQQMAEAEYGKDAAKQKDLFNAIGGGLSMLGGLALI